jgi:maltose alpha-D-glucosyltransferase/alpha-amylase
VATSATTWYRDAVFYEVPVKSFFDGNADGIGDFPGLTAKLDHVRELGATCLWLLPFYPSPLRDDGYDVTDYRDVHPQYGTMADFRNFLEAAHRRGLRVAAEMVINHTSNAHPWFRAARSAPPGSPLRDFYVWSDSPNRYAGARPVHPGERHSHWTWDETAKAFYFHRFAEHQPDLNYDNPRVREEMLKVLRFWADVGLDGLCLNGTAYLVEREGTSCEHLPETHAVLKGFRRALGGAYPELMLQAGVGAWPADVRGYFGDGDECHTALNLALTTRLFQALRQEDRHPMTDLLRQMPELPAGCQWITLLRNHDELTLALATDEERDYLYHEYAADPATRVHAGILRRLAPLADNNRARLELLFGLLLSLPGAPKIYYGDELGMGENVYLGGCNAIRTPMPWTADRNAGFSAADAARLFAPPVDDPVFGYHAVNVEAERRDPASLLHWVRRQLGLRRRCPALAHGRLQLLEPANRRVLAFVRQLGAPENGECILVIANLARTTQPVELDLWPYKGLYPVESFGRAVFPRIGSASYLFTLGPNAFHWFELRKQADEAAARLAPIETQEVEVVPALDVPGAWETVLEGPLRQALEREVLPGYLRSQRWFGGKARTVEAVRIADTGPLPVAGNGRAFFALLDVAFAGGRRDRYFLPLAVSTGAAAVRLYEEMRSWVLARLRGKEDDAVLHDALADDAICTALLAAVGAVREFATGAGRIHAIATTAYAPMRGDPHYPLPVMCGPATSSNSLVYYGRRLLLKLFRRLEEGINPDYEVGRFLTEVSRFDRIPRVAGALEYRRTDGGRSTAGILQELVKNQGDGWAHAVDELGRYYERAAARMSGPDRLEPDARPPFARLADSPPPTVLETIGSYLHAAATLGRRTAQMHQALAVDTDDPAFTPESLTAADMTALGDEIMTQARRAFDALGCNVDRLPPEIAEPARRLLARGPAVLECLVAAPAVVPQAVKTRVHGDYHLAQVLWVENDYVILDFEGEPTRTVAQRRAKFSPIRDVAGMLRSYHYAAYAGLFAHTRTRPTDFDPLRPWADAWFAWVAAAFLRAYLDAAGDPAFVPRRPDEFAALLDGFTLAKALYELVYELNNRPDWVRIPLGGVLALLEKDR